MSHLGIKGSEEYSHPQKLGVSQTEFISTVEALCHRNARPYQEDLGPRPGPLPLAGRLLRPQDQAEVQAL